ncbi:MAG: phospho-N-acetylmuramoyl-pentapeptide-transferase [Candidatus Mcinerneyibacterium aminivorans]|uniref:Phospho-N-acetylmuramoyl-pentapeptide-transferase n=1 Tax=Candidatus Mcinerneyibacterium aminivorans TaxID=2703815 RepID=A0A5D0MJF0_9BACT|nr:MAG: phospho-N-acetylmuramoyl-pentapeptide-transferase [Candidatus Mcinerneyibacterium aminivorans]
MIYYLANYLKQYVSGFNIFRYITFRSAYALLTALFLSFVFGPKIINFLKSINFSHIRKFVPDTHKEKIGTPSMGGILILGCIIISVLLWGDLQNRFVILALIVTVYLGVVGFIDDYLKIKRKDSKGVIARYKLIFQSLLGLLVGTYLYFYPMDPYLKNCVTIPFIKDIYFDLGILYIPFVMVVIVAASNAVNLADGLDGLAIGNIGIAIFAYGGLAYLTGNIKYADYLYIPFIKGTGELTVFAVAIVGASLGFLWYNAYPAQVFMGDVGSLALGGALGLLAVLIKKELLLIIIGGVFVIEALSVIIQVVYFRITGGKRFYLMAPIHHHFEKKGLSEVKVTIRFWIIGIMFALIGLSTLKIR